MYKFAKLSNTADAARLITDTGYYGWISPADLRDVDVYGLVEDVTLELLACVVIVRMGAQAYLDYFAVRADKRNERLGTELLERVRADLRKHDVRVVHTCVSGENSAAARMLLNHGAKIGWPYINGLIRLEDNDGD